MIKNERQYRITKARAEQFRREIDVLTKSTTPFSEVQIAGLTGQLTQLERELQDYEYVRDSQVVSFDLQSIQDLPEILIKARIASGMSQKELAARLGLKEQQIQRYEATDYAGASISRIRDISALLGVRLNVKPEEESVDLDSIFTKLEAIGISRRWAVTKLLSKESGMHLSQAGRLPHGFVRPVFELLAALNRVFGLSVESLLGKSTLRLDFSTQGVRYKLPKRANDVRTHSYTMYAGALAKVTLKATPHLVASRIVNHFCATRQDILTHYGRIDFQTVLHYVWSLGVAVLPLNDPGGFHGACIRSGHRNVIILKQRTLSEARWLFDLLHELFHASECPYDADFGLFEEDPLGNSSGSATEREANAFAADVIFDGKCEELLELCVDRASRNVRLLRNAVSEIAEEEGVDTGALANLMAFRLSMQGVDWWGTAQKLQSSALDPWDFARKTFMQNIDDMHLDDMDKTLLQRGLSD